MPPPDPLHRHQVLLFRGDFERLGEYYTIRSASDVIRTLVRQHLDKLDEQLQLKKETVGG